MSLWEFTAAIRGYVKANSAEDDGAISTQEAAALATFLDQPPVWR